jgi:hypothetical protein
MCEGIQYWKTYSKGLTAGNRKFLIQVAKATPGLRFVAKDNNGTSNTTCEWLLIKGGRACLGL